MSEFLWHINFSDKFRDFSGLFRDFWGFSKNVWSISGIFRIFPDFWGIFDQISGFFRDFWGIFQFFFEIHKDFQDFWSISGFFSNFSSEFWREMRIFDGFTGLFWNPAGLRRLNCNSLQKKKVVLSFLPCYYNWIYSQKVRINRSKGFIHSFIHSLDFQKKNKQPPAQQSIIPGPSQIQKENWFKDDVEFIWIDQRIPKIRES